MDDAVIRTHKDRLFLSLEKKRMISDAIEYSSRYYRDLTVFHSMAYTRSGNAISFRVSIINNTCPMQRESCLGEVLFYLNVREENYAFVKLFYRINCCFSKALPTVRVPDKLKQKLNYFFGFYHHRNYCYKVVPVRSINNKVITMPWQNDVSAYTDVFFDLEHDWWGSFHLFFRFSPTCRYIPLDLDVFPFVERTSYFHFVSLSRSNVERSRFSLKWRFSPSDQIEHIDVIDCVYAWTWAKINCWSE